jgi:predicted sugar kinase
LFYVLFYRPVVLGFRSVGPRIYSLITSNIKDEEGKKRKRKVEKENKMKETRQILA